jgi:NhaC family Na+:H+ antiporter
MDQKSSPITIALIPLITLVSLLAVNVLFFGDDALSFSNQLALLASAAMAGLLAHFTKVCTLSDLMTGVNENILQAIPAILILLLIGSLSGSWLFSGIVPAMIYYGLKILSPDYFLVSSVILCAVVSIATGSSWGTIATIGVALLGIGKAMNFSEGLIAGAIISGAYFGDKMSPLSDTTNLAPAVSGSTLIDHIKYMTITTIPSILITLVIFLIIGLTNQSDYSPTQVQDLEATLNNTFNLSPLLFVVPVVVILLIVKRVPAIPALAVGAVLGILFGFLFQSDNLQTLLAGTGDANLYALSLRALGTDFAIPSSNPILADLLSTGGMSGMLNTIWLIICAMIFGGIMEKAGFLEAITRALLSFVTGRTGLVTTTAASSMIMNATASDQYLAIVVPGKMYAQAYKDQNLAPENLSRTLEDAGTVTSVLIPYNTCGAAQAGVLGVATQVYAPFAFFCYISPIMTILVSAFKIRIKELANTDKD